MVEMIADCVKDYIEEACRSLHDPMGEEEKVRVWFYISGFLLLTHSDRDKMAAIFQTTFSNGFS